MAAMLASSQGFSHQLERLFQHKQEISIGRNPSNTIVLNATISPEKVIPDSLVLQLSRHHAKLTVKDGELQVMDNGTLNGTFINNLRIPAKSWRALKNGDVISLGGTNPLELDGVVEDNPWTFKVQSPERFVARYVAPSSLPNAETQSQGGRAREVYSFSAGTREETTRNSNPPQPTAAAPTRRAAPAPQATEVIDLTLLEDSPPRAAAPPRPKSASRKATTSSGPENSKRARPTSPPAASAPAGAGDGAVTTGIVEELTCPICQELIVAAYSIVPCGHNFCGTCLASWLANKQDCPNCRQRCTAPPLRAIAVDNIIALTLTGLGESDKKVYEERKKEWEKNKASLEPKLKDPSKIVGGGRAGGMMPLASYVGLQAGMMGGHPSIPGMGYVLQGGPSSQFSQNPGWSSFQAQQREISSRLAVLNATQSRIQRAQPQIMNGEQRFRCQYATAGTLVSCKGCHSSIHNNDLMLGMKTVSASTPRTGRHSGVYDWYHYNCFPAAGFRNARVNGFENMRNVAPADASRIRERLAQI